MKKIAALILVVIAFALAQPAAAVAGGLIDGGDIQNGSITGVDIDNGTLTGVDVRNGTIGNADLASGSVSSSKLGNGSVTTRAIATGQVASDEIKDNSIAMGDISQGAVDSIINQARVTDVGSVSDGTATYANQWSNLMTGSGSYLIILNAVTNSPAKVSLPGGSCITVQFGNTATCQFSVIGGVSTMSGLTVENADGSADQLDGSSSAVAVHLQ